MCTLQWAVQQVSLVGLLGRWVIGRLSIYYLAGSSGVCGQQRRFPVAAERPAAAGHLCGAPCFWLSCWVHGGGGGPAAGSSGSCGRTAAAAEIGSQLHHWHMAASAQCIDIHSIACGYLGKGGNHIEMLAKNEASRPTFISTKPNCGDHCRFALRRHILGIAYANSAVYNYQH
jgi:hypothetical protein